MIFAVLAVTARPALCAIAQPLDIVTAHKRISVRKNTKICGTIKLSAISLFQDLLAKIWQNTRVVAAGIHAPKLDTAI
jgi:hypothetical protein